MLDINNVQYFGVELDSSSRESLKKFITDKLPDDWNPKFFCDHMTIVYRTQFQNNQEIIKWCGENLDKEFYLAGLNLGISDKAIAIRVGTKVPSSNTLKHITIATNLNTNGKPVDSNAITEWKQCPTIVLKGVVKAYMRH